MVEFRKYSQELVKKVLSQNRRWIFVSASLHSDEDFGMAAYDYLISGGSAVLSNWGGHRDHAQRFKKQVLTVAVNSGRTGPWVNPTDLAASLMKARDLQNAQEPNTKNFWIKQITAPTKILSLAMKSRGFGPLHPRPSMSMLHFRHDKMRKVFVNYSDTWANRLFQSYGMTSTREAIKPARALAVFPWVQVTAERIKVNDPHRGHHFILRTKEQDRHSLSRREIEWILSNGFGIAITNKTLPGLSKRLYLLNYGKKEEGQKAFSNQKGQVQVWSNKKDQD
jgi:hypothetical protein